MTHVHGVNGRHSQGAGVGRRIANVINAIGIGVTIILFGLVYIALGAIAAVWRLIRKPFHH